MPEVTKYEAGTPSWVDLGTPDLDGAIGFYGGLFGWEIEKGPEEFGGYSMATLNGKNVAGLGPLMAEGQPPSWSTYVSVDDINETVQKVKDNGGQVFVEPMEVKVGDQFPGTMAVFADPTGAAFSAWQPQDHIGAELVNEPGSLTWNELMTRDVARASDFYAKVFGWGTEADDSTGSPYAMWKLGDRPIGGMMPMGDDIPAEVPANWNTYFAVEDADKTVAKAQELGGSVIVEPQDIPGIGRFAVLTDPQGATFSIIKTDAPPQ